METLSCEQVRSILEGTGGSLEETGGLCSGDRVRKHLDGCASCRETGRALEEESLEYARVFGSLRLSSGEERELRGAVIQALSGSAVHSPAHEPFDRKAWRRSPPSRVGAGISLALAILVFAGAAFSVFHLTRPDPSGRSVGTFREGRAELLSGPGEAWAGLSEFHALEQGDTLRTGPGDRCSLDFGHAVVFMAPKTRFQVPGIHPALPAKLFDGKIRVTVHESRSPSLDRSDPAFFLQSPAGEIRCSHGDFTVSVTHPPAANPEAKVSVVVREGRVTFSPSRFQEPALPGDVVAWVPGRAPSRTGLQGFVVIAEKEAARLLARVEGFASARERLLRLLMDAERLEAESARVEKNGMPAPLAGEFERLRTQNRKWILDEKRVLLGYVKDLADFLKKRAEGVCGPASVLLLVSSADRKKWGRQPETLEGFLASPVPTRIVTSLPTPLLLRGSGSSAGDAEPSAFTLDLTAELWNPAVRSAFLEREFDRIILRAGLARVRRTLSELNERLLNDPAGEHAGALEARLSLFQAEERVLCRQWNDLNEHFSEVEARIAKPMLLGKKGLPVPARALAVARESAKIAFRTMQTRNVTVRPYSLLLGRRSVWDARCEVLAADPRTGRKKWVKGVFRIDATDPGREFVLMDSVGLSR